MRESPSGKARTENTVVLFSSLHDAVAIGYFKQNSKFRIGGSNPSSRPNGFIYNKPLLIKVLQRSDRVQTANVPCPLMNLRTAANDLSLSSITLRCDIAR